jgi:hypothetical protein
MRGLPAPGTLERLGASVPQPLKPALRRARDLVSGNWPRSRAFRRLARADPHPQTYTDKLRWRMAYDRRPMLTMFADKVAVRDYVADRIGDEHLTTLHGVHVSAAAVDWAALPREYVCKASHGSGAVVLVRDAAPEGAQLPASTRFVGWDRFDVRPGPTVPPRLWDLITKWMTLNFEYGPGRLPEWAYRDIPPRVLFEELLTGPDGNVPNDYKFYTFDGTVRLVQVDTDRFGHHAREYLNRDGSPSIVIPELGVPDSPLQPSDALPRMVELAEELARGVDFVRVDLYDVGDRIVFGELTNYPGAAVERWEPESVEIELGSYWTLPTVPAIAGHRVEPTSATRTD